jgi:Mor transcription activator family.
MSITNEITRKMIYNYTSCLQGGDMVKDDLSKNPEFAGIYKDIADIIGPENVYLIYKNLRGQQVTFPKKLFTTEYTLRMVMEEYNGSNMKQLAVKYEYTERHLRRLLKEFRKK